MNSVVSRANLEALAKELHSKGKKIVATNGCFDLLHVGHVRYLKAAHQLGDVLIVGLNSDASVRKLKGPHRPVNSQDDRAEILASLECVDYVSVFDEDTAVEFLKLVKPEIYAKGGDYDPKDLPEAPTIQEQGGRIEILQHVPDKSTTGLLAKVKAGKE